MLIWKLLRSNGKEGRQTFITAYLLHCTESSFFPFRVDPFSERRKNNFDKVVSLENVSIPLKHAEFLIDNRWLWNAPIKSINPYHAE